MNVQNRKSVDPRVDVVCPFFNYSNKKLTYISCEPLEIGENIMHFENYAKGKEWQIEYCTNIKNFQNCPHAKALLVFKYSEVSKNDRENRKSSNDKYQAKMVRTYFG